MKTTAAVLHELQSYYDSLEIKPRHADIAEAAHLPKATVTRYLNGTTRRGDLDRVRAMCLALDREDLLDKLPVKPTINAPVDVWDLYVDQKQYDRESNLEEVGYERQLRIDAERRFIAEIERLTASKQEIINRMQARIETLESEKTDQTITNKALNAQLESRRRREIVMIISLILNIALACGMAYCLYLL
jgi:transcriptional regulator with XRE-family HTH domain